MPPTPPKGPQYLDEHHQRISEFAEWIWDTDEDAEVREAFVTDAMTKKGYTARTRTDWDPPEPPAGGAKGGGGGRGGSSPYFKR